MRSIEGIAVSLLVIGGALALLERLFPALPGRRLWNAEARTNLAYWFFSPLVTKALAKGVTAVLVVLLVLALGRKLGPGLAEGYGPLARQPLWLATLELLLVGDFVGYWVHRAFHAPRLWPFHAVHHSSRELNWFSAVRVHPVNDVLNRSAHALPIVALGLPFKALALYLPFLTLYAVLLHANVGWSFGPLRYVIASPCFHRWHHTVEAEGLNKNFAGLFPLFDLLFGTFHMPRGEQPRRFGTTGTAVPEGFLAQLAFPFSRSGAAAARSRR